MAAVDFSAGIEVVTNGNGPKIQLMSDLDGSATLAELLQFTKASLINIAAVELRSAQANGFDKDPRVLVDNSPNKAVFDVKPLGRLDFVAKADLATVLTDTYQQILNLSPESTGLYLAYNKVFHNGQLIASSLRELELWTTFNPDAITEKDVFQFVNLTPYARKLERFGITVAGQKTKNRKSRAQARHKGQFSVEGKTGLFVLSENGTYFLASRAIKAKYGKNTSVSFALTSGAQYDSSAKPGQTLTGQALRTDFATKNSKGKSGPYLYPSIRIVVSSGGLL